MKDKVTPILHAIAEQGRVGSVEAAWNNIANALERVPTMNRHGERWKIPPLSGRGVYDYGLGGKAIRLLGHYIYINSNGAFRINELDTPIFESLSESGDPFCEVANY